MAKRLRQLRLRKVLAATANLSEHDINNLMHLLRADDTDLWPAGPSRAFKEDPASFFVTTPQHVGHLLLALTLRDQYRRADLPTAVRLYADLPPSHSMPIDPRTGQPQPKKRREHPELRDKRLSGWLAAILAHPDHPAATEVTVWETSPRVELRLSDHLLVFHAVVDPGLAMNWQELNGRQVNVESEERRGFPRMTRVPLETLVAIWNVFEDVPAAVETRSDRAATEVLKTAREVFPRAA